jgi:DNA mismatch endonuclease (patch repair protein)
MDRLSPKRRSWNMSRIRGRDTHPERAVRSLLHRLGFRFRLHSRTLPGRPDVVLPKYHSVILVHGCFWHRHNGCAFAYTPKSRTAFWSRKFADNVARDHRTTQSLRRAGWRVIVVWECELRNLNALSRRLDRTLRRLEPARSK